MRESTSTGQDGPASVPFNSTSMFSTPSSSIPVEMSELDSSSTSAARTGAGSQGLLNDVSIPISSPLGSSFPTSSATNTADTSSATTAKQMESQSGATVDASTNTPAAEQTSDPSSTTVPPITRLESTTDNPPSAAISEAGPVLVITLLLASGARHPYKIDERYLIKRNVDVPGITEGGRKDPFSISVYTLKELILREWREEWETRPSSPSSIRLIFFGRLLDDKTPLKGMSFPSIYGFYLGLVDMSLTS